MVRTAREPKDDHEGGEGGGITGEYAKPNAAKAFDIYDKQIAPKLAQISTITGDCSQPWDDIKQHAHFPRTVMNFILALEGLEDAKRDHFLLALSEGLTYRKLFLPRDLVTMANGEDGGSVIPASERKKPKLVTVAGKPDDSDLADPSGAEPEPGTQNAAMLDALNAAGGHAEGAEQDGDGAFTEASEEELAAQAGRGDAAE